MTTQSEEGVTTPGIWQLDPAHTLVEFSGKHMMFTTVKGHFKSVRGTIGGSRDRYTQPVFGGGVSRHTPEVPRFPGYRASPHDHV